MADWSRYLADVPEEHREEVVRILEESPEAVRARDQVVQMEQRRLMRLLRSSSPNREERRHPERYPDSDLWGLTNGRRTPPRSE